MRRRSKRIAMPMSMMTIGENGISPAYYYYRPFGVGDASLPHPRPSLAAQTKKEASVRGPQR